MMKNKNNCIFIYIFILMLTMGCQNSVGYEEDENRTLNVYLTDERDENGYYHFDYVSNTHHHLYVKTEPYQRVYWATPDSFYVQHEEFENIYWSTPIVSNSIYADENGDGQQLFYVYENNVGDTLMVIGFYWLEYPTEHVSDTLYVVVE